MQLIFLRHDRRLGLLVYIQHGHLNKIETEALLSVKEIPAYYSPFMEDYQIYMLHDVSSTDNFSEKF